MAKTPREVENTHREHLCRVELLEKGIDQLLSDQNYIERKRKETQTGFIIEIKLKDAVKFPLLTEHEQRIITKHYEEVGWIVSVTPGFEPTMITLEYRYAS